MNQNEIKYDYIKSGIISNRILEIFPELIDFEIKVEFSDELKEKIADFLKKSHSDDNKDNFDITVFQFLGEYFPDSKLIKIYLLGLMLATDYANIDRDYQVLLKIVLYHEIGHYWFYNYSGLSEQYNNIIVDLSDCGNNNQLNACYIHEWVAQLFAYICLDTDEERDFMIKLAEKQPNEYRTFKDKLDIPDLNLILKNVSKLLHLPEVFERILNYKQLQECNIVDTIQDILNVSEINLSIVECQLPDVVDFRKINEITRIKNESDKYNI